MVRTKEGGFRPASRGDFGFRRPYNFKTKLVPERVDVFAHPSHAVNRFIQRLARDSQPGTVGGFRRASGIRENRPRTLLFVGFALHRHLVQVIIVDVIVARQDSLLDNFDVRSTGAQVDLGPLKDVTILVKPTLAGGLGFQQILPSDLQNPSLQIRVSGLLYEVLVRCRERTRCTWRKLPKNSSPS